MLDALQSALSSHAHTQSPGILNATDRSSSNLNVSMDQSYLTPLMRPVEAKLVAIYISTTGGLAPTLGQLCNCSSLEESSVSKKCLTFRRMHQVLSSNGVPMMVARADFEQVLTDWDVLIFATTVFEQIIGVYCFDVHIVYFGSIYHGRLCEHLNTQ